MDLDRWRAQLRKGAVELAVLAVLEERARYGLEILEAIRETGGLEISDGTIYPLLNRLRKDGKLEAEWVEDPGATHPRKYYRLTREGRALLGKLREVWTEHTRAMARLVGERQSS